MAPAQPDPLATAHQSWDEAWRSAAGRASWLEPEAEVAAMVPRLRQRAATRVLDLGSGVGRHALFLAGAGFETHALEASAAGIAHGEGEARARGLTVTFKQGEMTALPYGDDSFDYVLSWDVIYHGDAGTVRSVMREVRRVLRPPGLFQFTMLSQHDERYGLGLEIAQDTFVIEEAADSDKRHPHFYCDAAGLIGLVGEHFDLLSLALQPDRRHWQALAERRLYPRRR